MKVFIQFVLISIISLQTYNLKAQDDNRNFSFILNVAPIPTMGYEYGFDINLSGQYGFRSTASFSLSNKNYLFFEEYRFINQFIVYSNGKSIGFNYGPVVQLKNSYKADDFQSKHLDYYGYGLGGAIGYRFKLSKRLALIPNARLVVNYLSYKKRSDDPTEKPFLRAHPSYDFEPKFVVYLQYKM